MSESEDRTQPGKRKAQRRRALALARAERPIADVEGLKVETLRQCEAEFEERWGAPFFAPGGLAAGSIGARIVELWHAARASAKLESEARELYEKARKKLIKVEAEIREWREGYGARGTNTQMAGGMACQILYVLEGNLATCRSLTELEQEMGGITPHRWKRRDGRSALVACIESEANRPPMNHGPRRDITNRDLAVISLLVGAGPDGWVTHDRALRDGELVTPAKVIEDEEARVRRLREI